MKRHISIFAFLLGAFAVTAQAASTQAADTQSVFGGHYYIEDNYQICLSRYMSLLEGGGGGATKDNLHEGDQVTFYAHPDPGMKVKEWGYCFKDAASVRHYENLTKVSSTKTSYAWSAKPALGHGYLAVNFDYIPFSITFDRNGGEGEMQPITGLNIVSNAIRLTSCQFTRTGYEMVGWSNAVYWAAHQATIGNGATVRGEDFWIDAVTNFDGKLTALWEPNSYTVHFDGNGATSGSMTDQTFTYDEDAKELSANAFTNENQVFIGWATNETLGAVVYQDAQKVRNLTPEKNGIVNLFARWKPMHKVTFKEPAGFGGGELKVEYVKDGEEAHPPSDPGHKGFTLKGWDRDYHNVTSDLTVTAEYDGTEYWVLYHANGGAGDDPKREKFQHGKKIQLAPASTFSRTGYTLEGWMTNVTATAADYKCKEELLDPTLEDSFDLYAFWKPIPYKVHFDGNGATEGSMDDVTLDYGAPFEVPACKFKKTGCEFRFWQVLVNNVVVTNYFPGITVSNLTSKAGDTVAFRADWIGRYTVAFDGNGGEGTMTNVTYETGVEYALPSNAFTKTGYGFYGWATSQADADALKKPAYTNGQTVVDLAAAGDTRTLFAEWTTNRYTVVFNPNGDGVRETMEPQDFSYDEAKPLSPNLFTRGELWSFAGWSNSVGRVFEDGETVSNLCADDGGTVNLFARWVSERGPLSEAMGCDNLKWISDLVFDKTQEKTLDAWEVCTTNGFGGSCAQFVRAGLSMPLSTMHANIGTNGTLTFKWQPSNGSSKRLSVVVEGEKNPKPYFDEFFEAEAGGDWSDAKVVVPEFVPGETGVQIKIIPGGVTCFVDQMTWVPEGSHPEPTDADKVTISSAAVSNGKFSLSFPFNEDFDYLLRTNANLLIDSWGVMEIEGTKAGKIMTFEPQIIEGQPQLFYKVETIQKQ